MPVRTPVETGMASAQDLYPSAGALFGAGNGRKPRPKGAALLWLLAGALAALFGRRLLAWFDRNL